MQMRFPFSLLVQLSCLRSLRTSLGGRCRRGVAGALPERPGTFHDGKRVIQERSGSNVPTVSYTRGNDLSGSMEGAGGIGGMLARSSGYSSGTGNWSTHNYYHADGNGNITYLETSAEALGAKYRYDPFGNIISQSGTLSAVNTYRFSSKECHDNSGLYYFLYRWYDPNTQRWMNRDPMGEDGDSNLYRFAKNDPEDKVDAFGEQTAPQPKPKPQPKPAPKPPVHPPNAS